MVRKLTKYQVLNVFRTKPREAFILKEFENQLKTPHQTIKKYLKILEKENIIIKKDKKKSPLYQLNLENPMAKEYLATCEKEHTVDILKKDALTKRVYETASKHFDTHSFAIFGSYAKNLKGNDIDLLAIGKESKSVRSDFKKFSETYKDTQVIISKNPTKTLKKEVLAKHIILNNFSFWAKWII